MAYTDSELRSSDEHFARQLRDADFLRAHPEYRAPAQPRSLHALIAADSNIDPAFCAAFAAPLTQDMLNRVEAKQKPRAFTGEPITAWSAL